MLDAKADPNVVADEVFVDGVEYIKKATPLMVCAAKGLE